MFLFKKNKNPIFLKESDSLRRQLSELEKLRALQKDTTMIDNDICALRAGIAGEDTIAYELKNSHMPMYVIHDLYLKYSDLTAQIDYLIITRKCIFVIECKNLYGNVQITNAGDFIREITWNNETKHEGIYSPITQCTRHLDLIRSMVGEQMNKVERMLFESNFDNVYKAVVVLANPKTILNARYAKSEVKSMVVRADALIGYIKTINSQSNLFEINDVKMLELAQRFMKMHTENSVDYLEKYKNNIITEESRASTRTQESSPVPLCPKCGSPMVIRKATRGKNSGCEFYGCSKYPNCKGTLRIQ